MKEIGGGYKSLLKNNKASNFKLDALLFFNASVTSSSP